MPLGTIVDCETGEVTQVEVALPAPAVPTSVSPMRAKLALEAVGKYAAAEAAVNNAGLQMQIKWNNAIEFRRDDPAIAAIGTALSMSSADIDALFILAATGA